MTTEIKAPRECTRAKIDAFCSLVREGGQVRPGGLKDRVKRAQTLVFLHDEEVLAGIAAIKHPNAMYCRRLFERAGVPTLAAAYSVELGWVVVAEAYRGRKLSRQLVEAAIGPLTGVPLFATSRSKKVAMHKTLEYYGFKRVGQPFMSTEERTDVFLFVRDDT